MISRPSRWIGICEQLLQQFRRQRLEPSIGQQRGVCCGMEPNLDARAKNGHCGQ